MEASSASKSKEIIHIGQSELVNTEWNFIVDQGKNVWKDGGENGLKMWLMLKELYAKIPGIGKWNIEFLKEWNILNELDNEAEEHFLRQLFRIPLQENANMQRLMQIAYNIGQLQGSNGLNKIEISHPGTIEKFNQYKLDQLTTYMLDTSIFSIKK